jgi:hypothetical protein
MNIFVLDLDPVKAAQATMDKHTIKMILESAQLLCSPFEPGTAPYKRTHFNHPCAIWARESEANYDWLIEHALALTDEYTRRYGKVHKSTEVIQWAKKHKNLLVFTKKELTPFVQAMPAHLRGPDPVAAYRAYYLYSKSSFATWKSPATPPSWWS